MNTTAATNSLDTSVLADLRSFVFSNFNLITAECSSSSTQLSSSSSLPLSSSFTSLPTVLKLSVIESKPIHDIRWISTLLQDSYSLIRDEYISFITLNENRSGDCKIHTDRITKNVDKGGHWDTNYFLEEGVWNKDLCDICPVTAAVLRSLPICDCSLGYAYFSVIKPGTHISPHYGCSNCKLRIQLPLQASDSCSITIAGQVIKYEAGKPLIFDDSFLHEVDYRRESFNGNQDNDRVVLLIDIWNPELSQFAINHISHTFPHDNYDVNLVANTEANDEAFHQTTFSTTSNHTNPRVTATGDVEYDYRFKFLLCSSHGAGKSCFLLRFADHFYKDGYMSTIGVDFKLSTISLDDKTIRLQIWDPAGPERFRRLTKSYFMYTHGVFLLYDITDRTSFTDIEHWYSDCKLNCAPGVAFTLVGTKCDLGDKREVTKEEGETFAKQHDMPFFECSSKTDINVEAAVVEMSQVVLRKLRADPDYLKKMSSFWKTRHSSSSDSTKKKGLCTLS